MPDDSRLDERFSLAYEELRRLAASVRRNDPAATLSPTALVHEAWFRLARSPQLAELPPLQFKRVAARVMRQVLVDAARARTADKRGGGDKLVTFDESLEAGAQSADDVIALHDALESLAKLSPRQAQLVEGRFFGGLEVAEVAAALGISEATALRDWRAAKAWLALELKRPR